MSPAEKLELQGVSNNVLIVIARVIRRQVDAPLLVGDREERKEVLDAIVAEANRRGIRV